MKGFWRVALGGPIDTVGYPVVPWWTINRLGGVWNGSPTIDPVRVQASGGFKLCPCLVIYTLQMPSLEKPKYRA